MREEVCEMSEDGEEEGEEGRRQQNLGVGGCSAAAKLRGPGKGGATPSNALPPFSDQVLENVLENVLQFLTCRTDRNAASLVCRSWCRAEAQTRVDVFIGNCYAVAPCRAVGRFPRAQSVVLKGKPRFADFGLMPPGWGARFFPWALAFASAYSGLERLYLKRMTVVDADLAIISRSLPSFQELSLFCCDGFGTAGLAAVAANCRSSSFPMNE